MSLWDNTPPEDRVYNLSFMGSRWLVVAILLIALGFGGALLYYLFASESPPQTPPLIEGESFKTKPESAGGFEVPYQDKRVFENLTESTAEPISTLGPVPEAPLPSLQNEVVVQPQEHATGSGLKTGEPDKGLEMTFNNTGSIEEVGPVVEEVVINAPIIQSPPAPTLLLQAPAAPQSEPEKKSASQDEEPVKQSSPKYRVQLAALPTHALAEKEWKILLRKHRHLLGNMEHVVEKVDLPHKGIVYRLHAGAFETKGDARKFCRRSPHLSCFVL